eukprot:TRINITY_DN958_c1_g3_i3.p2 TRINITY_DN958_c1_g3~~TRINITY_DN958_c1_g3_i3.p2  ORF type:complete len:211 (+),score=43.55 TRINITY_DN958_c1_g3_i3:1734-2366(+)
MLLPHLKKLQDLDVVLGSGSVRRHEIFTNMGLKYRVVASSFEETLEKSTRTPAEYVRDTALGKANALAESLSPKPQLLVTADTVVVLGERILEKPRSLESGKEMLMSLSGKTHEVMTGVCIVTFANDGSPSIDSFVEVSTVTFAEIDQEIIDVYLEQGLQTGKAGAYGIQDGLGGATFVTGIEGDYFNVVGFPVHPFCKRLSQKIVAGAL